MQTLLHRAEDRGQADHGWLNTRYSFSFADWYDHTRMGFGALRVINDDVIAPASGFGEHGHRDMEIVTIVFEGTLTHKDSMGNLGVVEKGDVQIMSAGTGVLHSEYNASVSVPLKLFQIWIEPHTKGTSPRYGQKAFGTYPIGITTMVSPERELSIQQNARIAIGVVSPEESITYSLSKGQGLYALVIEGKAAVAGVAANTRDAVGVSETASVTIKASAPATLLLIEVPMERV